MSLCFVGCCSFELTLQRHTEGGDRKRSTVISGDELRRLRAYSCGADIEGSDRLLEDCVD